MHQALSLLAGVNWSAPTWDIFILLFFAIAALLYGLSLGRDRVIVILISMYMALAIVTNTPLLLALDGPLHFSTNPVLKVVFFLGTFILLFILVTRSSLLRTVGAVKVPGSWWQTILFSLFQVGLLISITLNLLPKEVTQGLSSFTKELFLSDNGRSAWMALPVLIMIFAPRQKTE